MANCPKCGQAIDADFGMFNCPSCQAFLSIDLDGNVVIAEDVPEIPSVLASDIATSEDPLNEVSYDNMDSFEIEASIHKVEALKEDAPEEISTNETDIPKPSLWIEDSQNPLLDEADMSDVVSFANSELSSSQVGGILYDIYLSGIDTAEIREEIRLNIEDRKFLWNVEDLMKSIKNGRLVIKRVNAVKAALFIQRIKHLDVDIQWKQNEIVRL